MIGLVVAVFLLINNPVVKVLFVYLIFFGSETSWRYLQQYISKFSSEGIVCQLAARRCLFILITVDTVLERLALYSSSQETQGHLFYKGRSGGREGEISLCMRRDDTHTRARMRLAHTMRPCLLS